MPHRFPAPWYLDELEENFVTKDANGQVLAHVYFETDPTNESRRAIMNRLTREKARRISASIGRRQPCCRDVNEKSNARRMRGGPLCWQGQGEL